MCKDVSVTLAGDEQRVLKQTPTGSIIVDPKMQDEAQMIVPFGQLIEILNCTVRWTRNGLYLHHPKLGRIRTRIKSGCPEMTDAGQAAAIIAELEMKKVEELRERTEGLRTQLHAVRMMEERNADWRISLARYAEEGKAVDGLQALYKSAIFEATRSSEDELGTRDADGRKAWLELLEEASNAKENEETVVQVGRMGCEPVRGQGQEARPLAAAKWRKLFSATGRGCGDQRGHRSGR